MVMWLEMKLFAIFPASIRQNMLEKLMFLGRYGGEEFANFTCQIHH